MNIKVDFPNPWGVKAELFFSQMRISLKAVEKTYQEAIRGLTEEEKENVYISFELVGLETTDQGRKQLDEIDPDYEERQNIAISVNYL